MGTLDVLRGHVWGTQGPLCCCSGDILVSLWWHLALELSTITNWFSVVKLLTLVRAVDLWSCFLASHSNFQGTTLMECSLLHFKVSVSFWSAISLEVIMLLISELELGHFQWKLNFSFWSDSLTLSHHNYSVKTLTNWMKMIFSFWSDFVTNLITIMVISMIKLWKQV